MVQGFIIEPLQLFDGRVRIGRGLKISDELVRLVALLKNRYPSLDLCANGNSRLASIGAKAPIIAIHASAHSYRPIDIGASKATIDGDPINTLTKALAKKTAEGVIPTLVGKSGRQED
jgi:hypothetical protein